MLFKKSEGVGMNREFPNEHNSRYRNIESILPCTSNIVRGSPVMLVIFNFLPGMVQAEGGAVGID